jgi:uncharacterized phage protein (TIGR02218 family)
MRDLTPELSAHLQGPATSLCWLWRITRSDGPVLGFTDHDRNIEVDGTHYEGSSGLTPSETDSRLGFSIDNGAVQGALSSDKISAEDIRAGLYENAVIESFRVNWKDTSQIVPMARGRLGSIRQKGEAFEAEWTGESILLDRSVGRVFSKICDAEFGDARCRLDKADFPEGTTCPRTDKACRDQFDNLINYRGFPYLLGDDALQAAPQLGERRDGSSRYK